MLKFGFDAPHCGSDTPFTVAALIVAALRLPTDGQLFVSHPVGFPVKFQPFPFPPAIVAELRFSRALYLW